MNITYDQEPAGFCPVQAEGFINGLPFYFRSRGRRWALHVARTPIGDTLDDDSYFHREDYPSGEENAASYAKPEECKQFIEKAAAILNPQPETRAVPCEQCGREVPISDSIVHGRFRFCSGECVCKCVGV